MILLFLLLIFSSFFFVTIVAMRITPHHITSHLSIYIHLDVDTFWTFVPYFK